MSIRNKIPTKVHPDIQDLIDIIESSETPNIPVLMTDAYYRGKRVGTEQLGEQVIKYLIAHGVVDVIKLKSILE